MDEEKKNLLETGSYEFLGPENGDINIDKIVLNSTSGAKRIWKIKSLSREEIVFKVEKFA